jgi:hypothetical protein
LAHESTQVDSTDKNDARIAEKPITGYQPVQRLEIYNEKNVKTDFFFEPRILIFTGKNGGYVDGRTDAQISGKLFFDTTKNKLITITREQIHGVELLDFFSKEETNQSYKVYTIYGNIPGDGHVFDREEMYIFTGVELLDDPVSKNEQMN